MKLKKAFSRSLGLALALAFAVPASAYDGARAGQAQTLSGGAAESFLIDGGGSLWAWGDNAFGQLGAAAGEVQPRPVRVLEGVRSVSAGEDHAYAVLEDNTLWAWGRDVSNAFPNSPNAMGGSAVPVKIMDDVAIASTGVCTHLAIKTDGSLWAWGKYVGDRTNRQRPAPVKIMDNTAAACTGFGHSLALKSDGSLWAWGQNANGGVGDGTTRERPTPVKVMTGVAQMTAGYGFSAAVKTDGSLWTWGRNWQGELGDGTTQSRPTPAKVMDHVASAHAANNNLYALREDGTLWAWGSAGAGEVGDAAVENRLSPVQVLTDVAEVSVGWNHVLARKIDGSLWTWGANVSGQLGNGESGFYGNYAARFSAFPIQVMAGTDTGAPSPVPQAGGSVPAGWAKDAVDQAIANGFLPVSLRSAYSQTITRGEFCALAVQFYESFTGREITQRASFPDTDDINVEKAAGLGVVSGADGGAFAPDAPLNREQAAVILASLSEAVGFPLPQTEPDFTDNGAVSAWARSAVGQVQGAGIMSGAGAGAFAPKETYTREQSAATIMSLYRHIATAMEAVQPPT